jgi:hypothetical protein
MKILRRRAGMTNVVRVLVRASVRRRVATARAIDPSAVLESAVLASAARVIVRLLPVGLVVRALAVQVVPTVVPVVQVVRGWAPRSIGSGWSRMIRRCTRC